MPTPAKADFVYALTATSQPPSLSFQISSLKVDASTASLGTPVTTTLSVPLIPVAEAVKVVLPGNTDAWLALMVIAPLKLVLPP